MKKLILILVAVVGVSATSCSSFGGSSTTAQDSLAYALGINVGNYWFAQDSTMNPDLICQGIKDVFAKKADIMKAEDAQQFIQTYMTVTKPKLDGERNDKLSKEYLEKMAAESGVQKSSTGLLYKIENAGSGEKPAVGDSLFVEFTLYDINGKKLQSSEDFGRPIDFKNEEGSMIKGFLEGVRMLAPGGKATLYIPSDLAYGEGGPSPKMALKFDVELVKVVKASEVPATTATPATPAK